MSSMSFHSERLKPRGFLFFRTHEGHTYLWGIKLDEISRPATPESIIDDPTRYEALLNPPQSKISVHGTSIPLEVIGTTLAEQLALATFQGHTESSLLLADLVHELHHGDEGAVVKLVKQKEKAARKKELERCLHLVHQIQVEWESPNIANGSRIIDMFQRLEEQIKGGKSE